MSETPSPPALRQGYRIMWRVVWLFGGLIVGLVVLHLANQALINRSAPESVVRYDVPTFRLRYRLLHLDREMSLPAWFSTLLLAANAGLMWMTAWAYQRRKEPGAWGWWLLGAVFFGLSLDESASVHDTIGNHVRTMLDEDAPGLFYSAWYLVLLPMVVLLVLVLLPWLWRLPRHVSLPLVGAGVVYLAGAVGCEAVMGWLTREAGGDPPIQNASAVLVALVVFEEGFEKLAMAWVFLLLLHHLRRRVSLTAAPPDAQAVSD